MARKTLIVIILITVGAAAAFLLIRYKGRSSETVAGSMPDGQNTAQTNSGASNKNFDACAVITNAEVEAVQGEPVKEAKSSSRVKDALLVSQCFYESANYSKSVSLEISQSADGSEKYNLRDVWKGKFDRPAAVDNDREEEEENERERAEKRSGESDKDKEEEEEKEGANQPRAIPNLGDAAFRVGNRITGALYVLKKNTIIRISLGGTDNDDTKTEKLKTLAEKALDRIK